MMNCERDLHHKESSTSGKFGDDGSSVFWTSDLGISLFKIRSIILPSLALGDILV